MHLPRHALLVMQPVPAGVRVQVRYRVGGFGRMKLQPLLYLPVGRVLIEHAYPMLRCTAYTVSPVHLLQVRSSCSSAFDMNP